eukprot:COSAG01_NODE_9003_length_2586_cov_1.478488_1_plen_139_part_10
MILCDVTGWVLHACAYRHSKKNLRKEALRHFGKKNGDIGDAAREILKIMQRFSAEAAAAGKALSTKALYGADGLIPMLSTAVHKDFLSQRSMYSEAAATARSTMSATDVENLMTASDDEFTVLMQSLRADQPVQADSHI